jgi:hypothetical protein
MSESLFKPNRAWGLKKQLTLEESVLIAIGYDPMINIAEMTPESRGQYQTLLDVLKHEVKTSLAWLEIPIEDLPEEDRFFDPDEFVFDNNNILQFQDDDGNVTATLVDHEVIANWMKSNGYSWPFDESGAPINHSPRSEPKEIDTRQKNNYLRVIAALMKMAKVPENGSEAAIDMQLQSLGFQTPKPRTIATILSEIRKLEKD